LAHPNTNNTENQCNKKCVGLSTHARDMQLLVGGVAQWLGRRSLTGGLSLIYA